MWRAIRTVTVTPTASASTSACHTTETVAATSPIYPFNISVFWPFGCRYVPQDYHSVIGGGDEVRGIHGDGGDGGGVHVVDSLCLSLLSVMEEETAGLEAQVHVVVVSARLS